MIKVLPLLMVMLASLSMSAAEVWWSPTAEKILKELGVKNKKDAQNKIKNYTVEFMDYEGKTGERTDQVVKGCAQIYDASTGINGQGPVSTILLAQRNCDLLKLYVNAKPANKSTLGSWRFTKNSLKELPARMNLASNENSYTVLQDKAARLLESWGDTDLRHLVKSVSPYEMSIAWAPEPGEKPALDNDLLKVSMLGRGDFSGDGSESLAILVQQSGIYPRDSFLVGVFIIRKKNNEKVFRDISDWQKPLPRCSTSRLNQVRTEVQSLYNAKKFTEASKRGDRFLKECTSDDLLDVPLAWLLSDLALSDYKRGDKASCLERLSTTEYLYFYAGGSKLEKAIKTNKELCSKTGEPQ